MYGFDAKKNDVIKEDLTTYEILERIMLKPQTNQKIF